MATLTVRMAGCVFSVSVSSASGPSKHRRLSGVAERGVGFGERVADDRLGRRRSAWPMPTRCEPWPGKMNAIMTAAILAAGHGVSRATASARRGTSDSAAKRLARAMPLRTARAEERPWPTRHSPLTPSSGAPPNSDASTRRAKRRNAGRASTAPSRVGGRRRQLLAQHRADGVDDAFADLQRDVAGEAVADDDVGVAVEQVAGLDVADERQAAGLERAERLAGQLIALQRFLADRQQADPRRRPPERDLGVGAAHRRELAQVRRLAVDGGADVEEHRLAARGRDRHGQRRPIDARQQAEAGDGGDDGRAGVPGAEQARHLARPDALDGDADRRGALAQRVTRAIGHADVFGSIDEGEGQAGPIGLAGEAGLELGDRADELEGEPQLTDGEERALDDPGRGVVAPHGVDRQGTRGSTDRQGGQTLSHAVAGSVASWLLFLDRARLPAAVVTAGRAHDVRRLQLAALRARAERDRRQRVVRAALGGAGLGVAAFGIRHRSSSGSRSGCRQSVLRVTSALSTESRGSTHSVLHWQVSTLRSIPQLGHSPWQSGRQSGCIGSAR